MLHSKALHYPSGYPMTRSPPLFVCSSPGPDPYRSHDNVYEELGPPRDSDAESDIALHSDDDFAEDESSLPGERSVNKLSPHEVTPTVATIYHERVATGGAVVNTNGGCCLLERSLNERNSLLSSSSSDRNGCGSSSGYGNDNGANSTIRNSTSPDSGLFRGGRRLFSNRTKQRTYSTDELNTSSEQTPSDVVPTIYDERNLLTLPYSHSNNFNNHSNSHRNKSINCCNTAVTNDEVERRNHINNQLSNNSVSTIYRGRTVVNGRNGIQQPSLNYHNSHSNRSRTNPRSLDRRRITATLPSPLNDSSYVYTEPMYHHDGVVYDSCLTHQMTDRNHLYPYILPEFTSFRNMANAMGDQPNQPIHPIYSRDSSFGSDSGYSHHTQTSGRGGVNGTSNQGGGTLSSINFGWGRNKENATRKGNNTFEAS